MSARPTRHQLVLQHRRIPHHQQGFFEELEMQLAALGPERPRHIPSISLSPMHAFVALALVLVVGVTVLVANRDHTTGSTDLAETTGTTTSDDNTTGNDGSTSDGDASSLLKKTATAVASAKSVQGSVTETLYAAGKADQATETHYIAIRAKANGDYWYRRDKKGADDVIERSYVTSTATLSELDTVKGAVKSATKSTLPSGNFRDDLGPLALFTSPLTSLASHAEDAVTNATFDDRAGTQVTITPPKGWTANASGSTFISDTYVITIDQKTSFPVRIVGKVNGQVREDYQLKDLIVDGDISGADMAVQFPSGASIVDRRSANGYQIGDAAKAKTVAGYTPYAPKHIPDGFALSQTATRTASAANDDKNFGNLVAQTFRNGMAQFTVTTSLSTSANPSATTAWNTANARVTGKAAAGESKTPLSSGAFTEFSTLVWSTPAANTLTAVGKVGTSNAVVTVTGDISRSELLLIAQSLQQ